MKRPSQKKLKKKLFDAVYDDNPPAVFEALSDGVDIDARDEDGWTALMIAADRVSAESGWVLRELLRMGANPALAACRPSGEGGQPYLDSALEQALSSGKAELAQFLIQQGAVPASMAQGEADQSV